MKKILVVLPVTAEHKNLLSDALKGTESSFELAPIRKAKRLLKKT